MEVRIVDNAKIFIDAKNAAVARALEAMGLTAERHAKENCPVDTGRLRNSISHAIAPENEHAAYIGTNVEYARVVELKDSKHKVGKAHFLRDAVADHTDEYRRIAEVQLRKS